MGYLHFKEDRGNAEMRIWGTKNKSLPVPASSRAARGPGAASRGLLPASLSPPHAATAGPRWSDVTPLHAGTPGPRLGTDLPRAREQVGGGAGAQAPGPQGWTAACGPRGWGHQPRSFGGAERGAGLLTSLGGLPLLPCLVALRAVPGERGPGDQPRGASAPGWASRFWAWACSLGSLASCPANLACRPLWPAPHSPDLGVYRRAE